MKYLKTFEKIEFLNEELSKEAIKNQIKVIEDQIDSEEGGDGEPLTSETLTELEKEKKRLEKLIEEYGNPIKKKIEKGQPVKIDYFNTNNLSDFTLSVLGFQYKHIFASLDDELKEYVE